MLSGSWWSVTRPPDRQEYRAIFFLSLADKGRTEKSDMFFNATSCADCNKVGGHHYQTQKPYIERQTPGFSFLHHI